MVTSQKEREMLIRRDRGLAIIVLPREVLIRALRGRVRLLRQQWKTMSKNLQQHIGSTTSFQSLYNKVTKAIQKSNIPPIPSVIIREPEGEGILSMVLNFLEGHHKEDYGIDYERQQQFCKLWKVMNLAYLSLFKVCNDNSIYP